MAKKSFKSDALEISGTATDVLLAGISLSCAASFFSNDLSYLTPFTIAGAIVPAYHLIKRNLPATHKRQFASNVAWSLQDQKKTIKWLDKRGKPAVDCFIFSAQFLEESIQEDVLLRFLGVAIRRQRIVFDPESNTLKPNGRKLKSNEILSEQFFTRRWYPRLLPPQYRSIKTILMCTGYWINSRVGNPGYLSIGRDVSAHRVLHNVRWRWISLMKN